MITEGEPGSRYKKDMQFDFSESNSPLRNGR